MNNIAIVGFGCAGYNCVKTLRDNGYSGEIHVFADNNQPPANPMLTTYYVYGKINEQGMYPFGELDSIINKYNIIFHSSETVLKVSAKDKSISTKENNYTFDKVLISVGATAFVPPIGGEELPNTFVMRTPSDACLLKEYLENHNVKSAVVVGASMVGIKIVELLNKRNVSTTLCDAAPFIFPLSAFKNVADEIEERLDKKGISQIYGSGITKVSSNEENSVCVNLADGRELVADIAVLCIGTRATTNIVDTTEINVNRGIVVNKKMETSAKDIYAAGDCCEGNNIQSNETQIIGLWANAGMQGECAALNMLGINHEFDGNIIHNITHFMDMDFISYGDNRIEGDIVEFHSKNKKTYIKVIEKDGKIVCVNILDNYNISGPIKTYVMNQLVGERTPLDPVMAGILIRSGMSLKFIKYIGGIANE